MTSCASTINHEEPGITTITTETPPSTDAAGRARRALGGTLRRIVETYRLGGRTLLVAPLLVAFPVLPELAQHVVEIRLGMFDSTEAFRALANDPTRWAFGYAKVAGFLIAILAIARFWAVAGEWRRLLRLGWLPAGRVVLSIVLAQGSAWLFGLAKGHGMAADTGLSIVSLLLQIVLSVYLVGGLLGDREASLRWSMGQGWPRALFVTLLLALTIAPCQALHMANHKIAIGAPTAVVWGMMVWDGLFVGLFAALVGSAMVVGYPYGPTWRGWSASPADRPTRSSPSSR